MSDRDAMIRWQGYARESRTAVNSHFLSYSAGVLGFQTAIIISKEVTRIHWPWLFAAGGLSAIASLVLGSIIVLVRLRDARLTARIARYRVENKPQNEIENLRKNVDLLGRWTNRLVPFQVIVFAVAALLFITWLVVTYWDKFAGVTG
jgi:hypothetical protein